MVHLYYFDRTLPSRMRGWTKIQVSRPGDHPYADAWWPAGHHMGYEHTFINQTYDLLKVLGGEEPTIPLASFDDAYETQRVLAAVEISAKEKRPVKLTEVQYPRGSCHAPGAGGAEDEDVSATCAGRT